MSAPVPHIRFFGDRFARDMGAVFAENLADLRAKVDDGRGSFPRGFFHTSTLSHPGTCYYDQVWARDAGRGVQELARWGFADEARTAVEYLLEHQNFGDHWGRLIDRPVAEDYELDGNTHILNGIVQTWQAAGRDPALGRRYLAACLPVFDWMARCMDACPLGDLIPCQSELAGNPCGDDPVYAVYPNYGAAVSMAAFAALADGCGCPDDAVRLRALAARLRQSLGQVLTSPGDGAARTPAGVWLNARTADGTPYETAHFGARFPIHHWTRQLPFIQDADGLPTGQDDPLESVHTASYVYLRHEMAKSRYFRRYGFVSNTAWSGAGGRHDDTMAGYGQNYFTQAALLREDVNTYGKCLEGIARLAYDGDVIEPAAFEMNPFIMHECFDYAAYEQGLDHTFGVRADEARGVADNPGDEGNLVQAAETLKTLWLVLGLSVEGDALVVRPRLPWHWDGMEVENLPVVGPDGRTHRVSLHYVHERWRRTCRVFVRDAEGLTRVRARFGPFPAVTSTAADLGTLRRQETPGACFFWGDGGTVQQISL